MFFFRLYSANNKFVTYDADFQAFRSQPFEFWWKFLTTCSLVRGETREICERHSLVDIFILQQVGSEGRFICLLKVQALSTLSTGSHQDH